MNHYSDPTASRALGAVGREWTRMVALAYRYRTDAAVQRRIDNPEWVFQGIFSGLLTFPLTELEEQLPKKMKEELGLLPEQKKQRPA